jgi:hypothetical protein
MDEGMTPRRTRPARRDRAGERRATQSVRIAPELRQRLRIWAAYQDREISDLIEEAVTAHLDALDRDRAARGFKPVPRPDEREEPAPRRGGAAGERSATWPSRP